MTDLRALSLSLLLLSAAGTVRADTPRVLDVTARKSGTVWTFDVTLSHPDSGWDHYADGWAILSPDGARLGYRELFHPHVDEQPFTRSLDNITIPDDATYVLIQARCTLDGWSGNPVRVELPH